MQCWATLSKGLVVNCNGPAQVQRYDRWALRGCARAGGMVEIFLFIIAAGVIAHFIGASVHEGIFVGALVCLAIRPDQLPFPTCSLPLLLSMCRIWTAILGEECTSTHVPMSGSQLVQVSMSSTSIVVKCLHDSKATSSPHGQITIGTLILQVRAAHALCALSPGVCQRCLSVCFTNNLQEKTSRSVLQLCMATIISSVVRDLVL